MNLCRAIYCFLISPTASWAHLNAQLSFFCTPCPVGCGSAVLVAIPQADFLLAMRQFCCVQATRIAF